MHCTPRRDRGPMVHCTPRRARGQAGAVPSGQRRTCLPFLADSESNAPHAGPGMFRITGGSCPRQHGRRPKTGEVVVDSDGPGPGAPTGRHRQSSPTRQAALWASTLMRPRQGPGRQGRCRSSRHQHCRRPCAQHLFSGPSSFPSRSPPLPRRALT